MRSPHLPTEAGASPSPARRLPPSLLSPEPAPGYEPDVGVASDERLQVPPYIVFVSLAQYVSHARDSLAQPRGLGALRRRGSGGPPSPPAPFPPPPADPRLVPGLALLQPPPRPYRDRLRPRGKGRGRAQGSFSLPTTRRRGGFPCLLRWVSPGPAGKACLASDGESGTSGPDEGCLCGEDMPELALLGVGWRRGPTQSPPIR